MSDRLEAWIHFKNQDENLSDDERLFVKDIETLQKENANLEAKVKELEERATISGGAWDNAKDYCRRFEKFWAKKYEEKVLKLRTVEAKVKELEEKRDSLFVVIKHGDRPHQDWLREVIYNHFTDEPMPEYVPSNRDKKIQTLEAKVKDYESSHRGACFTCEPVGELNKKLEAQLEVLTKCYCAGDRLIGPTCNGCKNKKLLEGVKGEN